MKILDFLFRDFWRKLVALIFAVVIYWQVSDLIKQKEAKRVTLTSTVEKVYVQSDVDFTVRMLDSGGKRLATFASGAAPKVRATLRGMDNELSGIRNGDLIFYIEIPADLKLGEQMLPVHWHIRRSGVEVLSVEPAEIRIIGNPVENHK
jgi:hypothetical protein